MTLKLACAAALLAAAVPAQAAELIFNFSGNSALNGTHGNARTFSDTTNSVQVRATGWSLEGSTIRDSFLGVWNAGLGVTSGDENGGNNTHATDNHNRPDFILLQFDQAVNLIGATFNTYSVNGYSKDSDATVAFGTIGQSWNSGLALNDQNVSALNALLDGSFTSLGTGSGGARTLGPGTHSGNLWLIGAAFSNRDGKIDGFKLDGLKINISPVPEPATWAFMLLGFGAVGYSLRRRNPERRLQAI